MKRPISLILLLASSLAAGAALSAQEQTAEEESAVAAENRLSPETRSVLDQLKEGLLDIEENGESFEKLEKLGDLYLQVGDAQRALLVFERAIKEYGGTEALYLKFARVLDLSGRPELAVDTLKIGLDAFPDSPTLSFDLAKTYISMRKPYAAMALLKKLVETDPQNEVYRYNLADAYRTQSKWESAMEIIDSLLDEESTYLPVHLMKGDLLLATGELRDGVRYLEDVYEEYPDSVDAKRVLVHAYQLYAYTESEAGRLTRAARSMRDALEVEPENGESKVGLASFLHEMGEYEEAEKLFEETLESQPDFLEAYMMFGKMLEDLKRPAEAKSVYEKGLAKARELGVTGAVRTYLGLLGRTK